MTARALSAPLPALAAGVLRGLGRAPLPLLRGAGRTFGPAVDFLGLRAASTTAVNLALAYPSLSGDERRRLARRSLSESATLALELTRVWTAPPAAILAHVHEDGDLESLDEARGAGRGVLLLVPHLGNWEVLNLWLQARIGTSALPFTALYAPLRDPLLDARVRAARTRSGARLVPVDTGGIRTVLRTLRAGGTVGILPDQVPEAGAGVFAPLFGRPARTGTLVRRLLRATGARAVVAGALRTPRGWRIRAQRPVGGLDASDAVAAAAALNASVEAAIAWAPEQYQWSYKRFRHPPRGVPDYYKRRNVPAK